MSLHAVLAELASQQFRVGPCGAQLRTVLQEALRDGTFPKPALLLPTGGPGQATTLA